MENVPCWFGESDPEKDESKGSFGEDASVLELLVACNGVSLSDIL